MTLSPPDNPTSKAWLAAAVDGDRSSLVALSRSWWPSIKRWCLLDLGDPDKADDAAQDVLVRLIRFIGTFDPARPFRPWLRTMARNACRDVANKHRGSDGTRLAEPAGFVDPSRSLDFAVANRAVLAALSVLTPRQREVFDLVDRQGRNATEAGALLEISPSTVRVLLRQARGALRTHLLETRPELVDLLRSA